MLLLLLLLLMDVVVVVVVGGGGGGVAGEMMVQVVAASPPSLWTRTWSSLRCCESVSSLSSVFFFSSLPSSLFRGDPDARAGEAGMKRGNKESGGGHPRNSIKIPT